MPQCRTQPNVNGVEAAAAEEEERRRLLGPSHAAGRSWVALRTSPDETAAACAATGARAFLNTGPSTATIVQVDMLHALAEDDTGGNDSGGDDSGGDDDESSGGGGGGGSSTLPTLVCGGYYYFIVRERGKAHVCVCGAGLCTETACVRMPQTVRRVLCFFFFFFSRFFLFLLLASLASSFKIRPPCSSFSFFLLPSSFFRLPSSFCPP